MSLLLLVSSPLAFLATGALTIPGPQLEGSGTVENPVPVYVVPPVVGQVLGGEFAIAPGAITIGRPRPRLVRRPIAGTGTTTFDAPQLHGVAQVQARILGTGQLTVAGPQLDGRGLVDNFARARRDDDARICDLADVA